MSARRTRRDEGTPVRSPWSARGRGACALAATGAVLVVVGIVLGNQVDGLSLATGLHALGVAAMIAAFALSFRPLWRFFRTDPRGKPTAGLLLLGFVASAGWLAVRVRTEILAGRYWSEIETDLADTSPKAASALLEHLKDDVLDDPRMIGMKVRIVERLGALGDARSERALLDHWRDGAEDPRVRRAAATSYGAVTKGVRVDALIEALETAGDGRDLVLAALRAATGQSHETQDDWLRWRLGTLLEEGTPDSVGRLLVRLGEVDGDQFKTFSTRIREGSVDPALRRTFEEVLGGKLTGAHQWSRRVLAVRVLGSIADPASVEPLKSMFRRVRAEIDSGRMRPGDGEQIWNHVGESLRAVAGPEFLDASRWGRIFIWFVELLGDDDEYVRNFAADELERMTGQKHGLDRAAWKQWREDATIDAWIASGQVAKALADLRRRVAEKDIARSARDIRKLVGSGSDAAIRELRALALRDTVETRIRTIAIDELTRAGKGLGKADLLSLLEELDEVADAETMTVVQAIVRALVRFDEAPVVRALHDRMLIEEDATLRKAILHALFRMFDDAVFAALVDAVGDEAPSLAAEAARELTKRTGKKLGVDPDAWRKWLEETFR